MPQAGSPTVSVGLRLEQIDHQADDVPGRAELAVDAGRGQLAEQVLVEVALGVALVSGSSSIMFDRRDQQARLLDHELGVLHVLAEGRAAVELAEVREDLVADDGSISSPLPSLPEVLDQRRCCSSGRRSRLERLLGALGLASRSVVSVMSSRRANIRNEICSMTVSGLVMPPVQNSSQSLSMSLSAGSSACS